MARIKAYNGNGEVGPANIIFPTNPHLGDVAEVMIAVDELGYAVMGDYIIPGAAGWQFSSDGVTFGDTGEPITLHGIPAFPSGRSLFIRAAELTKVFDVDGNPVVLSTPGSLLLSQSDIVEFTEPQLMGGVNEYGIAEGALYSVIPISGYSSTTETITGSLEIYNGPVIEGGISDEGSATGVLYIVTPLPTSVASTVDTIAGVVDIYVPVSGVNVNYGTQDEAIASAGPIPVYSCDWRGTGGTNTAQVGGQLSENNGNLAWETQVRELTLNGTATHITLVAIGDAARNVAIPLGKTCTAGTRLRITFRSKFDWNEGNETLYAYVGGVVNILEF